MLSDVALGECFVAPTSGFLRQRNAKTATCSIVQPVNEPDKHKTITLAALVNNQQHYDLNDKSLTLNF